MAPLPLLRGVELDDETVKLVLASQTSDAPPEAVKVSVTGPGATSGVVPKGMATDAPGVVATEIGAAKVAAALLPVG